MPQFLDFKGLMSKDDFSESDDDDNESFFDDDESILSDDQLFSKISRLSGSDVKMEDALRKANKVFIRIYKNEEFNFFFN